MSIEVEKYETFEINEPNEIVEDSPTSSTTSFPTTTLESELPICYRDTTNTEEEVICFIGEDRGEDDETPNGKYIAMFQNRTTKETKFLQLEDLSEVDDFRNKIALQGWRMVKAPTVTTRQASTNSRQIKRQEKRVSDKMQKRKAKQEMAIKNRKIRLQEELQKRREYAASLALKNKGKTPS